MKINNSQYKCSCWHGVHCGISCLVNGCDCSDCECPECKGSNETNNPNQYPVYPEDDGTDRPQNPYSQV